MLPELILREERAKNFPLLVLFGLVTGLLGVALAKFIFPSQADIVSVFLAAMPLIYPLTREFFGDEEETFENGGEWKIYIDEVAMYFSLFTGMVAAFYITGLQNPELFEFQYSVFDHQLSSMGITGYAAVSAGFMPILMNNLVVFSIILAVSSLIGSAGSFILAWNGSVLGTFLAALTRELPGGRLATGTSTVPSPLLYVPHATLEMGGFIVAGIAGTLISAAVYRRHFDRDTWMRLGLLVGAGVFLIVTGAFVETA